MPDQPDRDHESPEYLPLNAGPRQISQAELRMMAAMEHAWEQGRAILKHKLNAGAIVQVGPLEPNLTGFVYPSVPLVREAKSVRKPPGQLAAAEVEMLRDFYRNGTFEPAQLREIIDRFETEGSRIFRLGRERMVVVGCWSVTRHLAHQAGFRYHVARVRVLVRLHERGVFNAAGCIIHELLMLNREYFHGPSIAPA